MRMKKIVITKKHDDETLSHDYFYITEFEEEKTEMLKNLLLNLYIRSDRTSNYIVVNVDSVDVKDNH